RADVSMLPEGIRQVEAARLLTAAVERPFDLERGPVFRATLVRVSLHEWQLALVTHHVAADGWSSGILLRELAVLYAATISTRPPSLPALPIQYADFAAWQRDTFQADAFDVHLAYWLRQLADLPSLPLPFDRPRPEVRSRRAGEVRVTISPDTLA